MFHDARLVRLIKRDARSDNFTRLADWNQDAVQIKKLDHEEQVVFGEVYAPGFPDSQGDFMSPDEAVEYGLIDAVIAPRRGLGFALNAATAQASIESPE